MNKYFIVSVLLGMLIITGCSSKNKGLQKSPCASVGAVYA